MNDEMKEDIKKLDDNAKTVLKHSLFVSLAMVKQFEKRIIEAIDLLDDHDETVAEKERMRIAEARSKSISDSLTNDEKEEYM